MLAYPFEKTLLEAVALSGSTKPGIIYSVDVLAAASAMELDRFRSETGRAITIHWPEPPRIDNAISETVAELAEVAFSLWPAWPYAENKNFSSQIPRHSGTDQKNDGRDRWFEQAWSCCEAGKPPLPQSYGNSVNAGRLCSLFLDQPLHIILAVEQSFPDDPGLDALCRVLFWLSINTSARPYLLLPETLHDSEELAKHDLQIIQWAAKPHSIGKPQKEEKGRYWPIENRPHPQSPGEQILCRALENDDDLRGMFQFNVPVETSYGSRYLVDLVSTTTGAIVEVDGYRHHSSKQAFRLDRHRDYELQTSGYLVLRLPHDELVSDVAGSIVKIKNLIRCRQL